MSFKPRYIPKEMTPEERLAGEQELQKINRQYQQGVASVKAAREAIYAQQRAEAEAEAELLRQAAAKSQPLPADSIDISNGLSIKNGAVVPKPVLPPSAAVAKVQQFTELNEKARQNVRHRGIQVWQVKS